MAQLKATPHTPAPPDDNASAWEKLLWRLFNSPQAQASGLVTSIGPSIAGRVAAANPGLVKWVMDRSGNVVFGHAGQYHEELGAGMKVWAGGTIEWGSVKVFRDLGKAGQSALGSVRQTVAEKWIGQVDAKHRYKMVATGPHTYKRVRVPGSPRRK